MTQPPIRNRLLQGLPAEDLACCLELLTRVTLKPRQVLHLRSMPIEYCYFMEEGLVAVMADLGDGKDVEAWLIGSEGLVGLPTVLGGIASPFRRVVAVGGIAWKISALNLSRLIDERQAVGDAMLRYVHAVTVQSAQSGACAKRHSLDQRLACWLLAAGNRLESRRLPLTHALLSRLIGARRSSVTVTLGRFEATGAVEQRRGEIVILDEPLLETIACNCYGIIKSAYETSLRAPAPRVPAVEPDA